LPALAFVAGELAKGVFLGNKILHFYRIRLREFLLWKKIGIIVCSASLAIPTLVISVWVPMNPVAKAIAFSSLYLAVYYFAIRCFRVSEVEILTEKLMSRIRKTRTA
jgi:hypothetical protein